jgi:hypothetical protein
LVELLARTVRIRDVLGSDIGPEIGCPYQGFVCSSDNARIYYEQSTLSFDSVQFELFTTSSNKPEIKIKNQTGEKFIKDITRLSAKSNINER